MAKPLVIELDSTVREEVADYTDHLNKFNAGEISEEDWMKRRLWQGVYGQRQKGVQMVRIKIPYGVASTGHLRAISEIARTQTNSVLHITTRSAIQLHFVPRNATARTLKALAEVGLTSREACGNTVRNVTATPFAGITPDQIFDVVPLAEILFKHCLRNPYFQNFPRKFKISFSGSAAGDYGLSYMHDIGFVATEHDGRHTFDVFAGGGLGARAMGAELIHPQLPLSDLLISATAIMRLFNEHGNRKNRAAARMKFIKHKWGLEKFIAVYREEFDRLKDSEFGQSLLIDESTLEIDLPKEKADKGVLADTVADKDWLERCVVAQNTVDTFAILVRVRLGDLSADDMDALCDIVDEFGRKEVRVAVSQNLVLPHIAAADVPAVYERLKTLGYVDPEYHSITNVVACPGRSTCNLSLTSSKGLGDAIISAFENDSELLELKDKAGRARINISGCHNGCGQHAIGSIGFYGSSRMHEGKPVPSAIMSIAGGAQEGIRSMGRKVGRVTAKSAPQAVKAVLKHYADNANGHSFDEYLAEVDIKEIQALVKPFDAVEGEDPYLDYGMKAGEEYSPAVGVGECSAGVVSIINDSLVDGGNALKMCDTFYDKGFYSDVAFSSREATRHAMSAALAAAGEAPADFDECWSLYDRFFSRNTRLPERREVLRTVGGAGDNVSAETAKECIAAAKVFVEKMNELYRADPDNLKPDAEEEPAAADDNGNGDIPRLDLTGVGCPMNYVKAKLRLEAMPAGAQLEVIIDSGEPYRNVPGSLKNDGHKIAHLEAINDNDQYSMVVIKDAG